MRLRLDSIGLYHVRVPLREPMQMASGTVKAKEAVIVQLQTSRGVGWGESSVPLDEATEPAALAACWSDLRERLVPALLAAGEIEVERCCEALEAQPVSSFAKAGMEIAICHAAAMARGVPMHAMLGGVSRPIPAGLTVSAKPQMDEMVDGIARHLAEGYRQVRIPVRPERDVEAVAEVRQRWPDLPLVVDGGGAYGLEQLEALRNLDKYSLSAIEQPLPVGALDASAQLQAMLNTPICLEASDMNGDRIADIGRRRAGRMLRIDVQRAGSLCRGLEQHHAARKAGLTCRLSTTPDLGIGAAAALHLATLDGFVHPTDVCSSSRWFVDDLLEPPIVVDAGGYLHLPDGPGFGYRPSREKVEKHTVAYEALTA